MPVQPLQGCDRAAARRRQACHRAELVRSPEIAAPLGRRSTAGACGSLEPGQPGRTRTVRAGAIPAAAADGLGWTDSAGRQFTMSMNELADWRGNRADAGRIAPKGFPRSNKFA